MQQLRWQQMCWKQMCLENGGIGMDRLKPGHGNWVTEDRFWDREADLALFEGRIDGGANLLLTAQRRMGKTSLMKETARRLADRYVCVFADLQQAKSAADAVVTLSLAVHEHKPLWTKAAEVFANVLERVTETIEEVKVDELAVKLRAGLTLGDWSHKADQLLDILAKSTKPVLLMLDEVPILVNRILKGDDFTITSERRAAADEFMSWLRAVTIRHQGVVRVVLSGSIGLEPVLRQANLSATLNTFEPFELKPWDEETAVGCLEALAKGAGLELGEGAAAAMVGKLACCIPHHVQMFFTYAHDRCKRRGQMRFSASEVDEVYEREMLGIRGHAELTHYEDRLKLILGEESLRLAMDMLTEAAVTGCLTRDAIAAFQRFHTFENRATVEVQEEILRVLEHDGYVRAGPRGYAFESHLVRDWWKGRYGLFFTPILERKV